MRIAETVTFGGSGLDRAGNLRRDPQRMAELWHSAQVMLMWRGRPLLVQGERLAWVEASQGVAGQPETAIFLGQDEGKALFAQDVSGWTPVEPVAEAAGFFDLSVQPYPEVVDAAFQELRAVMALLTPRDAELAATARALMEWHKSHGFCAACGARSEVVHGGWQRSCPACKAQHFPRTDPVVIMLITRGNQVLMERGPSWPEGMYSLLAGFIEPGETIEAAVRREVFEESGVRVGSVGYLASQPWPFPASLMLGCRGEAISEEIIIDPEELADARWVSREDMVSAYAGQHPLIKPGRKGAIAHFLISNWLADRLD